MHGLDRFGRHQTVADIGLIGDDDGQKAPIVPRANGFGGSRQQPEVLQSTRRVEFSVAYLAAHENAVAVEKDSGLALPVIRTAADVIGAHGPALSGSAGAQASAAACSALR